MSWTHDLSAHTAIVTGGRPSIGLAIVHALPLTDSAGGYTTGQTLHINGGRFMP